MGAPDKYKKNEKFFAAPSTPNQIAKPITKSGTTRKENGGMDKDRKAICEIISRMLDNPDNHGIYPTSTAYATLEHYIEGVRAEALGWAHADACCTLDRGDDPRLSNIPDMLERAKNNLAEGK